MIGRLHFLFVLLAVGLPLLGSQCWPTGDDDSAVDDDDDDATPPDDDDSAFVAPATIAGTVIAIDRDTGAPIDPAVYSTYSGVLVVYVLPGVEDLAEPWAKVILGQPGPYEVVVPGDAGTVYAEVIADWDWDSIISVRDVRREYAFNPVQVLPGDRIEEVDFVIDVPQHGGGPEELEWTTISGLVNLINVDDGPIRVTANQADYWGPVYPSTVVMAGAGPYSTAVRNDLPDGLTCLLGYLDKDGNGLFEFDDWIGKANANPVALGLGDVSGVVIDIPATEALPIPIPSPYVTILGSVVYGGFVAGDIPVRATVGSTSGQVLDFEMLAAPGDFSLRVPAGAQDVLIWAVNDEDGDGIYELASDPFDQHGPIDVENASISGVVLELASASGAGSIGGTIYWDGPVSGGDVLRVGLSSDPSAASPELSVNIPNPTFPATWVAEGMEPGSWWVGAFLDLGGDVPPNGGPDDGEPNGVHGQMVVLSAMQQLDGIDVTLAAP